MSFGKPKAAPPPDYIGAANAQGQQSRETAEYNANLNRVNQYTPFGSLTYQAPTSLDGQWSQTMRLSPEQENLLKAQNGQSLALSNLATGGLARVGQMMGQDFNTGNLPGLSQGVNMSGVRDVGTYDDASRQRVEQALMSRLQPQFDKDSASLKNQLLNSGIEMGSDAWNSEQNRLSQAQNDARQQAVLAGGQEESRQAGLNLAAGNQEYQQALSNAQFGNQSRQQGFQENSYLRNLPLNELNALRTGSQVTNPQFQGYYQGGQAQASPVMDAAMAQGAYGQQAYQQQLQGYNSLLGGLSNLGTTAGLLYFSDRRLKRDIVRVGTHKTGIGIYEYTIAGQRNRGVMADEVKAIMPDAVSVDPDTGFEMVDYSRLGE